MLNEVLQVSVAKSELTSFIFGDKIEKLNTQLESSTQSYLSDDYIG